MKKILRNIILSLVLISMSISFVGCRRNGSTSHTDPSTPPTPPTVETVLNKLASIIDLENLSVTISGDASVNYSKMVAGERVSSKAYSLDHLLGKIDGSNFYALVPDKREMYFCKNTLYSRDIVTSDTYSDWELTYNNMLRNLFSSDEAIGRFELFLEPMLTQCVENIELINSDWVSTRALSDGGYALDIEIDLASILGKIQRAIKDTYSQENDEQTLEHFINLMLAERYENITLEDIFTELFGDDDGTISPVITKTTKARDIIRYFDDKFGLNTEPIIRNLIKIYYLAKSTDDSTMSANLSTDLILDTPIYSALEVIRALQSSGNESTDISEEEVRNTARNLYNKYLRNETYSIKYVCDKLSPIISTLIHRDIDIYSLLTECEIERTNFNLHIETNAQKTELTKIYGGAEISVNREINSDTNTTHTNYTLTADFNLTCSHWGETTVTPPSIEADDCKAVNVYISPSQLYENTSYSETFDIPIFINEIEIDNGTSTFSYTPSDKKINISYEAVNSMLGVIDGEKTDNKSRIIKYSDTIEGMIVNIFVVNV